MELKLRPLRREHCSPVLASLGSEEGPVARAQTLRHLLLASEAGAVKVLQALEEL